MKNKSNTLGFTTLLALGVGAAPLSAAVLVEYTFDSTDPGGTPTTDYTATTVSGVSANSFTDANTAGAIPGSSGSSLTQLFTPGNTASPLRDHAIVYENGALATGVGADMADAIANNQFVSITVSATSGALDLDNLIFDTLDGGSRAAQDFVVRSSIDGFAANLDLVGVADDIGHVSESAEVNLSGAEFDNVTSISFRIYVDNREGDGANGSGTGFDNVILNGTVIPEPSTAILAGLAGLGLLRRRR